LIWNNAVGEKGWVDGMMHEERDGILLVLVSVSDKMEKRGLDGAFWDSVGIELKSHLAGISTQM
jgi:hypothetical protein